MKTLACHPHLIVDDGGDLINLIGGSCKELGDCLIGGCEETTTGILRLKAREREGIPSLPHDGRSTTPTAKHLLRQQIRHRPVGHGTAIMDTTNLIVAGKTVVVAGYGWCGKGVAMRAKGMGANVIVTEIDPFKALDATMNGYRVMPMDEAAKVGDLFITTTGCKDIITAPSLPPS